jgi:chemotaxis protein histidine kinase CheA
MNSKTTVLKALRDFVTNTPPEYMKDFNALTKAIEDIERLVPNEAFHQHQPATRGEDVNDLATKWLYRELLDYGDLSQQAEDQCRDAFITGYNAATTCAGLPTCPIKPTDQQQPTEVEQKHPEPAGKEGVDYEGIASSCGFINGISIHSNPELAKSWLFKAMQEAVRQSEEKYKTAAEALSSAAEQIVELEQELALRNAEKHKYAVANMENIQKKTDLMGEVIELREQLAQMTADRDCAATMWQEEKGRVEELENQLAQLRVKLPEKKTYVYCSTDGAKSYVDGWNEAIDDVVFLNPQIGKGEEG